MSHPGTAVIDKPSEHELADDQQPMPTVSTVMQGKQVVAEGRAHHIGH